jgi:hypothetical protein
VDFEGLEWSLMSFGDKEVMMIDVIYLLIYVKKKLFFLYFIALENGGQRLRGL